MLHASLRGRQVRGLLLVALLACCTGLAPPPVRGDSGDQLVAAESLARSGQHAAAARIYEQQAKRLFSDWDTRLSLLAAREYLEAGRNADAERLLSKVDGRARGDDAVLLARIRAELALAHGDGPAALAALATIPEPWPAPLATELLLLEARADFTAGYTLDGIRALQERASVLGAADARAENYRLLLAELERPGTPAVVPATATDSERAWIELAQIRVAAADDASAARRAADWRTRHPNHPGADFLPASVGIALATGNAPAPPGQRSSTIALLLPLSGRQQSAGSAVRDGFIAASLEQRDTAPKVQVYDTVALGSAQAYQKAIADGAGIVIGPLTREDVAALAALQPMPVPTLALNAWAATGAPPAFLYQFTLDPEQEARAAARRIAADGYVRGIALFPQNLWGERLYAAFTSELSATGVALLSAQYYDPATRDFSGPLRVALGRYGGAGDRDGSHPPPKRDPLAEARNGPQFAFVAASAANARALVPQLRFQMIYALQVYSTSDAWDPGARAVTDLDGLTYPEIPWVLHGGQGDTLLWDVLQKEWAAGSRGRTRLYAFGHDAATVAQGIMSGRGGAPVDGLTGQLTVGGDGRVQRELDWAQIVDGRPQPAGAPVAQPVSEQ